LEKAEGVYEVGQKLLEMAQTWKFWNLYTYTMTYFASCYHSF